MRKWHHLRSVFRSLGCCDAAGRPWPRFFTSFCSDAGSGCEEERRHVPLSPTLTNWRAGCFAAAPCKTVNCEFHVLLVFRISFTLDVSRLRAILGDGGAFLFRLFSATSGAAQTSAGGTTCGSVRSSATSDATDSASSASFVSLLPFALTQQTGYAGWQHRFGLGNLGGPCRLHSLAFLLLLFSSLFTNVSCIERINFLPAYSSRMKWLHQMIVNKFFINIFINC